MNDILTNRELWLQDLENPEHQHLQGQGALCQDGEFCCLGRAAQLFSTPDDIGFNDGYVRYEGTLDKAPPSTMAALGLRDDLGIFDRDLLDNPEPYNHCELSLVGMNDIDQMSFKQIAEFIRANPRAIFTSVNGKYLNHA